MRTNRSADILLRWGRVVHTVEESRNGENETGSMNETGLMIELEGSGCVLQRWAGGMDSESYFSRIIFCASWKSPARNSQMYTPSASDSG